MQTRKNRGLQGLRNLKKTADNGSRTHTWLPKPAQKGDLSSTLLFCNQVCNQISKNINVFLFQAKRNLFLMRVPFFICFQQYWSAKLILLSHIIFIKIMWDQTKIGFFERYVLVLLRQMRGRLVILASYNIKNRLNKRSHKSDSFSVYDVIRTHTFLLRRNGVILDCSNEASFRCKNTVTHSLVKVELILSLS